MGAVIEGIRNVFPVLGDRLPYDHLREAHMNFFYDGMVVAFAAGMVFGMLMCYTLWRSLPLWRGHDA